MRYSIDKAFNELIAEAEKTVTDLEKLVASLGRSEHALKVYRLKSELKANKAKLQLMTLSSIK